MRVRFAQGWWGVLAAGFALALPLHAHASPALELIGSQSQGGATARVSARDASATYFNPALLPRLPSSASFGLTLVVERIDIELAPRGGSPACAGAACDVPEVNGAGPESFRHEDGRVLERPTLPTEWLEEGRRGADDELVFAARPRGAQNSGESEHGYLALGMVGALLRDTLSVGLHLLLPLEGALETQAFYADEREQLFSNSLHPELYGDRLTLLELSGGIGLSLMPELSIGASASVGIASSANAPVYVSSLADLDAVLIDSRVSVSLSLAPLFGVLLTPARGWKISATAHSPQGTEIQTAFSYVIATGIEQRAAQRFVYGYLPWILGLGVEAELLRYGRHTLGAALSGTYALWSSYRDRHGERPRGDEAWNDVPSASVALQHRVGPIASALDVSFALSPVPEQDARTSYVDGDRIGFGLGTSYTFDVMAQPAHVGVHAQLHRVLPEHVTKDPSAQRDEVPDDAEGGIPRGPIEGRDGLQTNSPGFPGFASDGWLLALGVEMGIQI